MENEIIMSPGDVSALLDIKESTLRKYALILKDAGYHFNVNKSGQRWYYNKDVIALKKLIEIKEHPDMTLEQAAKAVVSWFNQSGVSLPITENEHNIDRNNDDITELKEMVNQQNIILREFVKKLDEQEKFNHELVHRLDQQQKLLDQPNEQEKARLEQHDKLLMESIRESQESKRMFLEIQQQLSQIAVTQEEERKKGFFARLFGK